MTLNTYLTFEDSCREVFEFYRSVFGGDFTIISTFGDGPPTWAPLRRSRAE
jgi:PhnB protein